MPGPVPNRSDDLARPRSRKGGDQQPVTQGILRDVGTPLDPDPGWHPIAVELYEALGRSGQCDFYQDSDWAFAWSVCDDLSYAKRSGKRSGQLLQTIYSAMERLLVTEGDRRRVRLELTAPAQEDNAALYAIDDYKKALGVAD